ncbi:MAG: hypothetical protein HY707_02825 [Ignavibacteriae bacterium]|nr:hypothetical protein [Ignavibacteriota bacterium]
MAVRRRQGQKPRSHESNVTKQVLRKELAGVKKRLDEKIDGFEFGRPITMNQLTKNN